MGEITMVSTHIINRNNEIKRKQIYIFTSDHEAHTDKNLINN